MEKLSGIIDAFTREHKRMPSPMELAKIGMTSTVDAKLALEGKGHSAGTPLGAAPLPVDESLGVAETDYSFLDDCDDSGAVQRVRVKNESLRALRSAYHRIMSADPYAQPNSRELKTAAGHGVTHLQALDFLREIKR